MRLVEQGCSQEKIWNKETELECNNFNKEIGLNSKLGEKLLSNRLKRRGTRPMKSRIFI
jgi:hypothetical protein